jgi:hypothetical protein
MYEGIKQIKDLIYKDGHFVDNPKYIPNIGYKSAQEIDDMRSWFVKKYLTPHQENQSMNQYKITVEKTLNISYVIDANTAEEAKEMLKKVSCVYEESVVTNWNVVALREIKS